MLLDFTQDLLRCHEPKVSVEADTGQLREVRHCPYAEEEDQSFRTFLTSDLFFLLISGLLVYMQK